MTGYPERDLVAAGSPHVPDDFLQSVFVAEAMHPSQRLWITSPWISDIEIIDNTARQFSSLSPDWPATRIRLSAVLATILERGGHVFIAVNDSPHNDEFLARLDSLAHSYPDQLRLVREPTLHEKGILGDRFTLDGSMNLTYGGVHINEEHLIYRCDPAVVAERRLELENRWRHAL